MGASLDSFFFGFDTAIYDFICQFDCKFLNVICDLCQLTGNFEAHIVCAVISFLLLFPKKTRKFGVALCSAWVFNFFAVHILAKPGIGRVRPYTTLAATDYWETFKGYWIYAGMNYEEDMSCPSGHTTLAFTVMGPIIFTLSKDKKYWSWALMIIPIIIALSRIYRCVHYPSDVLFGIIFGLAAAVFGYLCGQFYEKKLKSKRILKIEL